MKLNPKSDLDTYFKLGEVWDQELYGKMKRNFRFMCVVAGLALLLNLILAFALMSMAPLKQTQPYVIMVDKTNGYLEEVRPMNRGAIAELEAVVESELVRYINARETWDPVDYNSRAEQVRVTSDSAIFRQFVDRLRSQTAKLSSADRRFVDIKSVQVDVAGPNTAFVRFATRTQFEGVENQAEHWIATIAYEHKGLPLNNRERLKNPLGFIVSSYRVDRESLVKEQ